MFCMTTKIFALVAACSLVSSASGQVVETSLARDVSETGLGLVMSFDGGFGGSSPLLAGAEVGVSSVGLFVGREPRVTLLDAMLGLEPVEFSGGSLLTDEFGAGPAFGPMLIPVSGIAGVAAVSF